MSTIAPTNKNHYTNDKKPDNCVATSSKCSCTHSPVEINNFDEFSKLVNFSFTQRRKTLRNILKGKLEISQIEALNIEPTLRPERLSLEDFSKLSNTIVNK